jgi:hypothetical protein
MALLFGLVAAAMAALIAGVEARNDAIAAVLMHGALALSIRRDRIDRAARGDRAGLNQRDD